VSDKAEKTDTPFNYTAPSWANTGQPTTDTERLKRCLSLAQSYYPLGVQTGVHAMIEWCGILTDYVRLLKLAVEAGTPINDVDQHSDVAVEVPVGTIVYFCGKLGCLLKPFIKANAILVYDSNLPQKKLMEILIVIIILL
jgi:hypothetical protein